MRQNRQSSLCSHQLKRHKIYGLLKLLFKCCCFREIFSKRRSSIDIVQWDFKMINLWKISALILNMVSATIVQSILEASFLKYLMFYYGLCKERQNKGGLLLKKKKKIFALLTQGHDPAKLSISLSPSTKQREILQKCLSSNRSWCGRFDEAIGISLNMNQPWNWNKLVMK